jgi:hypothetical protein
MMAQSAMTSQNGTNKEYMIRSEHLDWALRDRQSGDGRPSLLIREQVLDAILAELELDRQAIASARFVPWSSATFEGTRHIWSFAVDGEAERKQAARFCAIAAEHEWRLQGAFVADLLATLVGNHLILEVLTVLER